MNARSQRLGVIAGVLAAIVGLLSPASAAAHELPPHVLVYSGTEGFRHLSIDRAKDVLARAAAGGDLTLEFSEDPAVLTAETLDRTDVVVWLSTTGSTSPFTDDQEQAYEAWLTCGGGHVGVHASSDSWKDGSWPGWEELTGAFFAGHPVTPTSAADDSFTNPDGVHPIVHAREVGVDYVEGDGEPEATIGVADPDHPTTAAWAGDADFLLRDEYYYYDRDPATGTTDYQPLLTFEGFTDPAVDAMYGGNYPEDQPVAWAGSFRGHNRTFYTNLGHGIATWDYQPFVDHVVGGIRWTAPAPTPQECVR